MRRGACVVVVLALAACPKHDKASVSTKHEAPVAAPIVVPPAVQPPFEVPPPTDPVVSLGRSDAHACVVRASGVVDCWGQHTDRCDECALRPPADPAVWRATGVDDAVAVDAHARCVLRKTGAVACLAFDTRTFEPRPDLAKVVALAGTCFLVEGGRIRCDSEDGKTALVRQPTNVVALGADGDAHCALTKQGRVWCSRYGEWEVVAGLEHVDELAITSVYHEVRACVRRGEQVSCYDVDTYYPDSEFGGPLHARDGRDIPALTGARQLSIDAAQQDVIAEGVVGGKVIRAVLGREGAATGFTVPTLGDAVQHVAGCAIRAQGSVVCWGSNRGGVLGQPTTLSSEHTPPRPVVGMRDIVDIAMGTTMSFALTRAGQVFRWGSRDRDVKPLPVEMPLGLGPKLIVQLEADDSEQLCMRTANGLVWCQTGMRYDEPKLEQIDTDNVQSIAVGGGKLFAVRADGSVHQFKIYADGGDSEPVAETLAVTNVVEVATDYFTCLRKRDGTVGCQAPIPGYAGATALAVGGDFDCAVRDGGRVWCRTFHDGVPAAVPVEISGLREVTDLAASRDYACAVHGGAVSCWQFTETGVSPPAVVIASGARDVELGAASHQTMESSRNMHGPRPASATGCALMLDATLQCWGANIYGEVGDGSLVESATPIGVRL